MSAALDIPVIRFRRVELADIDQLLVWLLPRVQEAYLNATPGMIRRFLVTAHMEAGYWFGRTDNACAVGYIEPGVLGNPPLIRTVFAFGRNGKDDSLEVAELYFQMSLWVKRMGALGLELSLWSDAERMDVNMRLDGPRPATGKVKPWALKKGERWFWFLNGEPP